MAAISYDPVETLKAFSDKHSITFPLLSDAGSKTIDAWGIRNTAATGRTAGIPHPGTFMLDRSGKILSRSFEQPYQERRSATSILSTLAGNLLLVGSLANLIVAERAAGQGVLLSFRDHARAGVPITVISMLLAGVWLWAAGLMAW